jgi:hypothetical protein
VYAVVGIYQTVGYRMRFFISNTVFTIFHPAIAWLVRNPSYAHSLRALHLKVGFGKKDNALQAVLLYIFFRQLNPPVAKNRGNLMRWLWKLYLKKFYGSKASIHVQA